VLMVANGRLTRVKASPFIRGKAGLAGVNVLAFDRSGSLWAGSNGYGVDRRDTIAGNFTTLHQNGEGEGLPFSSVRAIASDHSGALWVGGYGGLVRRDPQTGLFDDIPCRSINSFSSRAVSRWMENDNIYVLLEDPEDPVAGSGRDRSGTMWIGTEGGGLYRYDLASERFYLVPLAEEGNRQARPPGWEVFALCFDGRGRLLVGTDSGLYRVSRESGAVEFLDPADPSYADLPDGTIQSLFRDDQGQVWIGSYYAGMARYDPDDESFTAWRYDPRAAGGLSSNTIYGFHQTDDGCLWIATASGMNCFDADRGEFGRVDSGDGLPDNTVYGILEDSRQRLWLSTNRGLCCYTPETGECWKFDASDGLQADEFNAGAWHAAPDGEFYFGGIGGLTRFRPSGVVRNETVPPVVLTGISVMNRQVRPGREADGRLRLEAAAPQTDRLVLSHRDIMVSFEFAALNYVLPGKNEYAIRLEGQENEWQHIGRRRFATYTNLAPGDYVFRVRGSNNDGVWNMDGAAVSVIVVPPYWATWWFRGFIALLIIGAAIGGMQLRLRLLKLQKERLQQVVDLRTGELRRSEARIHTVMESLPFDLFVLDGEGHCLMQNAACRENWGPLADGEGPLPMDGGLLAVVGRKTWQGALDRETQQKETAVEIDGRERHFHVIMAPITDRELLIGILGVIIDVTDRVEAEAERRRLEQRMFKTQHLESLSVMAGGIAHDFNNLLTAILGSAELARAALGPDHEVDANLTDVITASRRAADLCSQMLAYSGHGRFLVGPIDLGDTVADMYSLLQSSMQEKSPLSFEVPSSLPAIEADVSQVRQVVLNLVLNAAEANEGGEPIILRTGAGSFDRPELEQMIFGEDRAAGAYVWLDVVDRGCGMTPETVDRIFEPFFSTKFVGRGLGLAAVHGIVRGHGGAIRVESRPGEGTTVRILFPALESAVERWERKPQRRAMEDAWKGQGMALVADDEDQVRRVATAMLKHLGFSVITARDGLEAVELYRRRGKELAFVLLDLTMPRLTGEQACREILAIDPRETIVLASGYSVDELSERYDGQGLAGFLQKPFNIKELAGLLQRVLQDRGA